MTDVKIFGIKNCNSMKKAFDWFDDQDITYDFHDYKKSGIDEAVIKQAIKDHGWKAVINTRGTTWRKVDDHIKNAINDDTAITLAAQNPSVVKRPLVLASGDITLGFDAGVFAERFG